MSLDDLIDQLLLEKAPPPTMRAATADPLATPNTAAPAGEAGASSEELAQAQSEIHRLKTEAQKLMLQIKVLKAENEAFREQAMQLAATATAEQQEQSSKDSDLPQSMTNIAFPWKRHIATVEDSLRKKEMQVAECALRVLVDVSEAISVEPAARARLLTQLGTIRIDQGRIDEAEQTLTTAQQLIDQSGIGTTLAAAFCLDALAQCNQLRQNYEAAEKLRRQAVIVAEDLLGGEHPDCGYFRDRLDLLRQERSVAQIGGDEDSKTILDLLTAEYNAAVAAGADTTAPVTAADGYASLMFDKFISNGKNALAQKNLREAESYLRSALEKSDGVPSNDPKKCEGIRMLAGVLEAQGKDNESKELYERALTIAFKHLGWQDVQIAHCLFALAELHNKLDDFGKAKNYYQQAVVNFQATLGREHETTKAAEEKYAGFLDRLKTERQWKGWSQ